MQHIVLNRILCRHLALSVPVLSHSTPNSHLVQLALWNESLKTPFSDKPTLYKYIYGKPLTFCGLLKKLFWFSSTKHITSVALKFDSLNLHTTTSLNINLYGIQPNEDKNIIDWKTYAACVYVLYYCSPNPQNKHRRNLWTAYEFMSNSN